MDFIYLAYIGLGFVGMVAHFLKRRIKGETLADAIGWFKNHFNQTLLSVLGMVAGLFIAYQMGELGYLTAIGSGYAADSVFNRFEKK